MSDLLVDARFLTCWNHRTEEARSSVRFGFMNGLQGEKHNADRVRKKAALGHTDCLALHCVKAHSPVFFVLVT